ncbi:MAG: hypothetical protein OEZ06_22740 [Myxococcales bacterium]|nr:hypothetical protein [Myxococcales bacterium]
MRRRHHWLAAIGFGICGVGLRALLGGEAGADWAAPIFAFAIVEAGFGLYSMWRERPGASAADGQA